MRRKRITDFLLLTVLSAGVGGCAYLKPSTIDPMSPINVVAGLKL